MTGQRVAAHLVVYLLFAFGCGMIADGIWNNSKITYGVAIVAACLAHRWTGEDE